MPVQVPARRLELKTLLESYQPSVGEERAHALMQDLARSPRDVLSAYWFDPGHFTVSGFITNTDATAVLLVHHRKLDRWLQPGGHIEPADVSLVAAARRELDEETGLAPLHLVLNGLFDVDVHRIPAHGDAPPHLHHDLRFLFSTDELAPTPSSEARAARWVRLDDLDAFSTDASVRRAAQKIRRGR